MKKEIFFNLKNLKIKTEIKNLEIKKNFLLKLKN